MAAEEPDCAIIDANLGGRADFAVADTLRERGAPFLFFTGYDREVIPPASPTCCAWRSPWTPSAWSTPRW